MLFQNSHLNLLSLMLVLLGHGVRLLLPFLSASTKSQHNMKSELPLNVVVRQSTSIFQLLASKDWSLLVRRNSFLDLGLYIFCGIWGLDLECDDLPRQGLHKNLHLGSSSSAYGRSEALSSISNMSFSIVIRKQTGLYKVESFHGNFEEKMQR